MPIFEVQGPDGSIYEVDAPDMERAAGAFSQQPSTQTNEDAKSNMASYSPGFMAKDAAKSGATGLTKGIIGMAGTFGDVGQWGGKIAAGGASLLGMSPENVERARSVGRFAANPFMPFAPTSEQLTQPVEQYFHKPQTTAGEYAQTGGEFLPSAMAGPGGALRKTAMATIPAFASETAGQLTKGKAAEPYARFAGATLGGLASAGRQGAATKAMQRAAPSDAALQSRVDEMYDTLRNAGIKYDANAYDEFATKLVSSLRHMREKQAPKAKDALDYIVEHVGGSPDYSDLESMRRTASALLIDPNHTERGFAKQIVKALDKFDEATPLISDGSIPAGQVAQYKAQARELAQRNIKRRKIDTMMKKAETYQSGYESGLRNQASNLLRKIAEGRDGGWSKEEIAALKEVAKGTVASNALGIAGRAGIDFSDKGNRALMLPGALAAIIADVGLTGGIGTAIKAGGAVAAASGAKIGARKMTESSVDRLKATVRAGKGNQLKARELERKEGLKIWLRRLLAAQAGV